MLGFVYLVVEKSTYHLEKMVSDTIMFFCFSSFLGFFCTNMLYIANHSQWNWPVTNAEVRFAETLHLW